MRVFFRTDSSKRIGSGHVIRCLTLANELRANGADISFVCREHDGHLIDKIIASGFDVRRLSFSFLSDQNKQHFNGYLSWLGVEQSQDAEETIDHLKNENCDLLIVDHYALDATWEKLVRPYTQKIMVIDDLANRVHDCDVLLDQNYLGANQSKRYSDKVPSHCQCFLGPEFSLLQPQYESLRDLKQQHNGQVQSILVFFGGTDPSDYTSKALQALAHPDFEHLTVHTVIGANHPNPDEVKSLVENLPKGYYHENLPSLAGLMLQCDFMIGGGGTTTWEKMCLGVPAIVATIAENQEAFSKALAESGYHLLMNRDDYESQKSLQKTISSAIHDHKWLLDSSENSAKLVDGLGAKKLAFYLLDKKQNMYFCKHQSRQKEHLIVAGKLLNGLTVLKTDVHEKNDDRIEFSTSSEFDGFNLSKVDDMRLEQLAYLNEMLAIEQKKFLAESVCETKPNKQLKITILTEKNVWLFKAILELCTELLLLGHQIRVVYKASDLIKGDVCLMLGYTKIIKQTSLDLHQNNLVVHESDLPKGKGWSPLTWQILEGKNQCCVSLFEAEENVDNGPIYLQEWLTFKGDELSSEWRQMQADATKDLCLKWVENYPEILKQGLAQKGEASFYAKRSPKDSQILVDQTIEQQFNLLRVVDNKHYPAFFEMNGTRYQLQIQKA